MSSEQGILKIVVTGPESSGKTTLAAALSDQLAAPVVLEFAREYLAHLGRAYQREDLAAIGAGQQAWERWYEQRLHAEPQGKLLICDTDWTVLHVWEQYRFQAKEAFRWQQGYTGHAPADLYLLCAPDFPWQPDPLREHPEERNVLFGLYRVLLEGLPARFIILEGPADGRLEMAAAAIRKLL